MHNRLLTVVALLTSAVVGCDDPEVQDKVADLMEHGAAQAEVTCNIDWSAPSNGYIYDGSTKFYYSAIKLVDGSCFSKFCQGTAQNTYDKLGGSCFTNYAPRSSGGDTCTIVAPVDKFQSTATYPYRPFKDGIFAKVSNGQLQVGVEDNNLTVTQNCGTTQYPSYCIGPQTWFSYDITTSGCTGRNLEAFGVTP